MDIAKGYFRPNELGFIVNDLVVEGFPDVLDVDFTAKMENDLDSVEAAEADSVEILTRFYKSFKKELDLASTDMLSIKGVGVPTELFCSVCKKKLHIKIGKNGEFLACSGYPECTCSMNYTRDEKGKVQPVELTNNETSDKVCEKCGRPMIIKQGKYGEFLACSGYPECKNTLSLSSGGTGQTTGVKCSEKGCNGDIVERKSRRGKIFYGCSRFPECTFATWDKPVAKKCPECSADFVVEKITKKEGAFLVCLSKGCSYKEKSPEGV